MPRSHYHELTRNRAELENYEATRIAANFYKIRDSVTAIFRSGISRNEYESITNPIHEYTRFDRNWPELIGITTNHMYE